MKVRGTQAGCQVTCACGKISRVPSLSELNDYQGRDEATPTVNLAPIQSDVETKRAALSYPNLQFYHCCGRVGRTGNLSSLAMNHYVELVRWRLWQTIKSIEHASVAEFVLSVAIAPGDRKRIEFDLYPKDATSDQFEQLSKQIREIQAPPIHDGPIAFAFLVHIRHVNDEERSLSVFPSLSQSMKSLGVDEAIRQAFGMAPAPDTVTRREPEFTTTTWWHRLLLWRRPKPHTVSAELTAQERFLAQEHWLQQCESMAAEFTWLDLKRAVVDAPDDLRYRIAFAAKHFQQEAWVSAIKWYDGLVHQAPNFTPLLGRRASLNRRAGNSAGALRDYSQAIEQAPHEASYWVERSSIYAELKAWEQAAADLNQAIQLTPIDPEPHFHRALVRLEQHKPAEAKDDLREAVRLDPNFGHAHFRLGWLYSCIDADKAAEAIEHLSRAITLTDDANIWLHRSLAYLAQNKFALAMEDCDHVLAVEPDHAMAQGTRGRILQCEGRFEEAIVACSRAIELGHEHAAVYLARAISYASTDQLTLATSDCDAALALEPNNVWAIQIHGRLKLQTGDLDAAMDSFHRARELAPDWVEPREQLSLVHRLKENPRASVEEQTQLIERQPSQASHYVNRAFAFTQLHEYTEAANDYDRAIELEPENERIFFLRGIFRVNCQQPELALADFERVLAITGDDDNARVHRANLLMQLNRYQEAIDDYAQLIAKYPENPHAYSGRAFALAALGNTDRAQQDANRVIEMSPESADGVHRSTETANLYRLMRSEEYDAALTVADQIVVDYPDQSLGYRLRAYVRWEREEYVESYDDYTRVIEMDGPTSDCLSARGQVQTELGEWDRALRDLNQAVDMARQAGQSMVLAYALNGRSLTLAGMERDDESDRDFEESVSLCPTNPWVYYHRGIRKFHLHELAEAKVLLELALEFNDPPLSKRKKQRAKNVLEKVMVNRATPSRSSES